MVNDAIIIDLHKGTLTLDCLTMRLERRKNDSLTEFTGVGLIQQHSNGSLTFKLFASECPNVTYNPFHDSYPAPGAVVPDEDYYSLTVTDGQNRTWVAQRILPCVEILVPGKHLVVTGVLRKISNEVVVPFETCGTKLTLTFYDEFEYPSNVSRLTEIQIDGKVVRGTSHFDTARCTLDTNEVVITKNEEFIVLDMYSEKETDPKILLRVLVESMQFVFARPFRLASLETLTESRLLLELHSKPIGQVHARLAPPVNYTKHEGAIHTYKLLDSYFRYAISVPGKGWHPVSSHVYSVIEASEATLDAMALAISVAVEGVLNEAFRDMDTVTDEFRDSVERTKAAVEALGLEGQHRKRIQGVLGSMLKSRPKEKLYKLANDGKIRKEHIVAWESLRNKWAHGNRNLDQSIEEIIWLIDTVRVLFYCLIFAAIGYKGEFTDYSSERWLNRPYPESMDWP